MAHLDPEMTLNFFDYFPIAPKMHLWGLYSGSFGQVRIAPRTAYPPAVHPEGHHFSWEQGRILQDYQLLYISEGRGIFESTGINRQRIGAGTVFLLFPGIWHRYRPDFSTGWVESWIELNGPCVNQLQKSGVINPKNPVYRLRQVDEIEELYAMAYRIVRTKSPVFSIRLAFVAMEILTILCSHATRRSSAPRRVNRLVAEAQALLSQNLESTLSAEKVAHQLGIGYSYFRREFKQQTGFSPKQYQIEIRHRRTKDLLRNSSLTIKEIADRLGYHSPYHLSLEFSKRTHLPPMKWRMAMLSTA